MPPSFFAVAIHNKFEYNYVDLRINSGDDSGTSCKNLVNFGPITLEITRLKCVHQRRPSRLV